MPVDRRRFGGAGYFFRAPIGMLCLQLVPAKLMS
jgi:hypothetical protein